MQVNSSNIHEYLIKENIRIERKQKAVLDSNTSEKIEEALTSLANRYGGVLLIGVKDTGELERS